MERNTTASNLILLKTAKTVCISIFYITIALNQIKAQNCQAFFHYANYSNPNNVYFIDSSTNATSWQWDFGDSTISSEQYPSHQYNSSGNYYVCLTISDSSQSCTNTYCDSIFVGLCEAFFSYLPVNNSNAVQFLMISNGNPTELIWDFGDSTLSNETNPIHFYNSPGTYYVCLTSSDSVQTCLSNFCYNIVVGEGHQNLSFSVCDGNWTDSSTWANGNIPLATDTVIILNNVILNTDVSILSPGFLLITSLGELCGHYNLNTQFMTFGSMQVNHLTSVGNCVNNAYVGTENGYSGSGNSSWAMKDIVCVGCPFTCNPINPCLNQTEQNFENENKLTIYPNPNNGKFTIINDTKTSSINLINLFGEKVYTITDIREKTEIDISFISKGIYFLFYDDGNKLYYDKIIIE